MWRWTVTSDTPGGHLRRALEALGQPGADPLKLWPFAGKQRAEAGLPDGEEIAQRLLERAAGDGDQADAARQAIASLVPDHPLAAVPVDRPPGPQPCPEAQGLCPVCGRQLPFRYAPPRQLVIGQHANVGGDPCAGAGCLPVAWRMPGGGPVPAGLRRRPVVADLAPPQPVWPQDQYEQECLACGATVWVQVWGLGGPATVACACGLACTWSYDPRGR